jgi:chemotaxis protein methyltransferase CheR
MAMVDGVEELLTILHRRFGHDANERQVASLMQTPEFFPLISDPAAQKEYFTLLRTLPADAPLVQTVVRHLMNKESYFFRDPPAMASLREHVLPALIDAAAETRVLRIWSAGCSTGEELYTISILLHELLPERDAWSIVLVGTDIDAGALNSAKRARYKEWSLRSTPPHERNRYFTYLPTDERYELRTIYLRDTAFALHNLADRDAVPPAPGCFDLVLCRNVSIYFSAAARDLLSRKLVSALSAGGVLVTGPSDARPTVELESRVLPGLIEYRKYSRAAAWSLGAIADVPRPAERRPTDPPPPPVLKLVKPVASVRVVARGAADLLDAARSCADRGELDAARRSVDQVIAADPLHAEAYLLRALLLATAGDAQNALADLRRVVYLDPHSVEAHLRLGLALERLGQRRAAIRAFRNAAASGGAESNGAGSDLQRLAAQRMTALLAEEP